MKSTGFLLTLLLLTVHSLCVYSQAGGLLSGRLQDETGAPIPYGNVAVIRVADSMVITGSITDDAGTFAITTPARGVYILRLSAIGFKENISSPFEVISLDFSRDFGVLTLKEDVKMLREVTVNALRPSITVEPDRMIVGVEGTALAAGNTAFDVLAKSPGVWVDQDGNLQLNGKAGVQVMIDNRLTYLSAKDLQTMLQGMAAENIRNIEIISNPSARYDAEGTAGIINVNLKKNTATGLNGSLYSGYQFNGLHTYSAGGSINFKKGRWNSHANLDASRREHQRLGEFNRMFNKSNSSTRFDQGVREDVSRVAPSMRLGTDVDINSMHSVGAMVNLSYQKAIHDFRTDTYIRTAVPSEDLFIEADNYLQNILNNKIFNLHYLGKFDTLGSTLSAELDLIDITSAEDASYLNSYDSLSEGRTDFRNLLTSNNPTAYDIYSAKLDYSKSFQNGRKLELGGKASHLASDNSLRFFSHGEEGNTLDPNRSNHFLYKENIYAAYVNFSTTLGSRFSLQAGLRGEQTIAEGRSLTLDEGMNRRYLNLFPSLFVQQKVSDNYQINYNYSRRNQRPDYELLNPFVFYLDPFTWAQGNPYLKPMYTHSFGIIQTFKQTINLSFNYSLTKDFIAEVPVQNAEDKTTIFLRDNLDNSRNFSATMMAPLSIMKNWDTSNKATVGWQYFSTDVNGQRTANEVVTYMLQSTHNILLPQNYRVEVNAAYVGPQAYGLFRIEKQWWVDLGVKKSFLNDKADLSLSLNDIFRSRWMLGSTKTGRNSNEIKQYLSHQSVGLNLRYRFSKGEKFELRKRSTNLEEVERAGGN
ncbi:outer membrane beta-barrel family protein [Pontibacter pamirensis]|uniref:outer membrane beta-barrel family protein n=1 Tax=Pontibacter pamirensis TaxID=2562824 RepID=UPI00138A6003|nr:outer membrane beta-barrel family protein [Pontibacter pamirensis]